MKMKLYNLLIMAWLCLQTGLLFSQTLPPHPNSGNDPGSGNTPVGGGAPVGEGLLLLVSMGAFYTIRKYSITKRKLAE